MQVNVYLDCMNIEWKVIIQTFYIYQLIFLNGELIQFILRCLFIWPILETQLFNAFKKNGHFSLPYIELSEQDSLFVLQEGHL